MANTFKENYQIGKGLVESAPQLYLDVDIEADGKPGYGSMLSIGAVAPNGSTFYRELKPSESIWLPKQKQFCEDHDLNRERLLAEGTEPDDAIEEFDVWARQEKDQSNKNSLVFTAFNASFDFPYVDLYLARAGIENPFGVAGYCIKSLAQALNIDTYNWRETSKGNLPADITPEGDFTHHALEDAVWQQELHFALVGKLSQMSP